MLKLNEEPLAKSGPSARSGLTLIELLISLSVVTIIMSLLASSLALLTRISADQSERRRDFELIEVLQSIANDMQRTLPLKDGDGYIFSIGSGEELGGDYSEIRLATSRREIVSGDYAYHQIEIRRYYLERNGSGRYDLMLEKIAFRGPGSEGDGDVYLLAENLREFEIAAYSGEEISSEWVGSDQVPLPQAVAISAALDGASSNENVHVYIAAGNSILIDRETLTTN